MGVGKPDSNSGQAEQERAYKLTAYRVVAAQFITAISIAGILLPLAGPRLACSALAGGLAGALPSLYLALRMFRLDTRMAPSRMLRSIYVGEAIKVVSTVALFVIAILLFDLDVLTMLAAYAATIVVNWLALLLPDPVSGSGA